MLVNFNNIESNVLDQPDLEILGTEKFQYIRQTGKNLYRLTKIPFGSYPEGASNQEGAKVMGKALTTQSTSGLFISGPAYTFSFTGNTAELKPFTIGMMIYGLGTTSKGTIWTLLTTPPTEQLLFEDVGQPWRMALSSHTSPGQVILKILPPPSGSVSYPIIYNLFPADGSGWTHVAVVYEQVGGKWILKAFRNGQLMVKNESSSAIYANGVQGAYEFFILYLSFYK